MSGRDSRIPDRARARDYRVGRLRRPLVTPRARAIARTNTPIGFARRSFGTAQEESDSVPGLPFTWPPLPPMGAPPEPQPPLPPLPPAPFAQSLRAEHP